MRKRNRMMCALLAAVLSVSALAPCSMPVYAQEMVEELTEAEETAAELDTVLEGEGKSEVIPNDETGIPDKGRDFIRRSCRSLEREKRMS